MMRFTIVRNGQILAKFLHESDRDACLDTLRDLYPDCSFEGGCCG